MIRPLFAQEIGEASQIDTLRRRGSKVAQPKTPCTWRDVDYVVAERVRLAVDAVIVLRRASRK